MTKLLILIACFFVTVQANALDRYVNPACSSGCDGTTWEKGWVALADIVWTDLDDENSNLYIGTGTYTEQLYVRHNTTGSRLTIRMYNGQVIINPGVLLGAVRMDNGYVTIDGSYNGNRALILADSYYGISHWFGGLAHNIYRYIEIYGSEAHGVALGSTPGPGAGTIIEYCYIHDNGTEAGGDGINASAAVAAYGQVTIRYNTIEDNAEDGINFGGGGDVYGNIIDLTNSIPALHADGVQGAGGYWRIYNNKFISGTQQVFIETVDENLTDVRIYNNIFEDGQGPAIIFRSKNIVTQTDKTFSDIIIANNTFIDPTTYTLRMFQDYADLHYSGFEFSNNISYSPGTDHMTISDSVYAKADLLMYNNIFYSPNTVGYDATDDGGGPYNTAADFNTGTGFTGNTNSQPLFIDYTGENYQLSGGDTVAKNTGKDMSVYFTTDYTGNTRFGAWDIGAYEFTGNFGLGSGPAFTFTGPAITLN